MGFLKGRNLCRSLTRVVAKRASTVIYNTNSVRTHAFYHKENQSTYVRYSMQCRGGHWGVLETAKPKIKSSKTAKPPQNSLKTENRMYRESRYNNDKRDIQSKLLLYFHDAIIFQNYKLTILLKFTRPYKKLTFYDV